MLKPLPELGAHYKFRPVKKQACLLLERERVRTAIKNSGYSFPPDKITVNLAPADIKKETAAFDFPIALGILACRAGHPTRRLAELTFLGELALDGTLRPLKGAIAVTAGLKNHTFVLSAENAEEAALAQHATVYPVNNMQKRFSIEVWIGNGVGDDTLVHKKAFTGP